MSVRQADQEARARDMADDQVELLRGVLDAQHVAALLLEAEREGPGGRIVDFRCICANQAAQKIFSERFGLTDGCLLRRDLSDGVGERMVEISREAVETGEDARACAGMGPYGLLKTFDIASKAHGDLVVMTYTDVTETIGADEPLSDSAARLEPASSGVGIGLWDVDYQTGRSSWDARMRALHGLDPDGDEPITTELSQSLTHSDDWPGLLEASAWIERTGVMDHRHRIIRRDGEVRHVHNLARVVLNGGERRIMGVCLDVTDEVEAAEQVKQKTRELERLARRLDLATSAADIGVWELDLEAGDSVWDARTRRIHGLPVDDDEPIPLERIRAMLHPSERDTPVGHNWSEDKGGRRRRIIRADGEERCLQVFGRPVEDGSKQRIVGVCWDITDEVRAAADSQSKSRELERIANRLDIATGAANIGVWELDLNTHMTQYDERARAIYGLSDDECVVPPERIEELLHPSENGKTVARGWPDESRATVSRRRRILRPDGEERFVQIFGRRTQNDGEPKVIGVCWDVTDEVRANQEIVRRASEIAIVAESLSVATEVAEVGVWALDTTTKAITWNDKMHALLGVPRDVFTGDYEEWRSCIHPEDVERVQAAMDFAIESRGDFSLEHRVVRTDGEVRHWKSFGRMLGETEDGRLIGAALDLTDQVNAADALARKSEEAEAASHAKSRFLASMSHEIRTPMNGVLGMAQALALTGLTARQRQMVDTVVRSGESLLGLLNDILDLSRVEAGALTFEVARFHLGDLVRDVGQLFSAKAEANGLTLNVSVAPDADVEVSGDALRMRQILSNLVSNAVKFTEQGRVTIAVERDPETGGAVFTVEDTGVGIEASKLSSVFDVFVQADDSQTRRFGGSGLGLSIVRRLAEAMGGDVDAASEFGEGSTFTVRLPVQGAEDGPAAANGADAAPSEEMRSGRVLVAEDDMTNQAVIEALLETSGLELSMVRDGAEAVAAWEKGGFDMILMDISMPVLDGVKATRAIRARERETGRERVPIVAVTANVLPDQLASYAEAGVDLHVVKPLERERLLSAVCEALSDRAPRRRTA